MAKDGAREPSCPATGLAVPECSCSSCLEAMLRELHPELLAGEIRVTRSAGDTPERREAA